jgi:hypothetical protein
MSLWICGRCTAAYAVGLDCCPQCGGTEHEEDGVAKISRSGVSFGPGRGPDGMLPPGAAPGEPEEDSGDPVEVAAEPVSVADQRAAGIAPEETVTIADQKAGIPPPAVTPEPAQEPAAPAQAPARATPKAAPPAPPAAG